MYYYCCVWKEKREEEEEAVLHVWAFPGAAPAREFCLMTTQSSFEVCGWFDAAAVQSLRSWDQRCSVLSLRAVSVHLPPHLANKRLRQQQRSNWGKNRFPSVCRSLPESRLPPLFSLTEKVQLRYGQNNPIRSPPVDFSRC